MLSVKAIELIEKRYLDTGAINHNEIMELFNTVRIKNHQLEYATCTISKLGGQPDYERTVN